MLIKSRQTENRLYEVHSVESMEYLQLRLDALEGLAYEYGAASVFSPEFKVEVLALVREMREELVMKAILPWDGDFHADLEETVAMYLEAIEEAEEVEEDEEEEEETEPEEEIDLTEED